MSVMAAPETLRVLPSHPSQGAWVEINAEDFDPARHVRYAAPDEPPANGNQPHEPAGTPALQGAAPAAKRRAKNKAV